MRVTIWMLSGLLAVLAAVWILPTIPGMRGLASYLPLHNFLETLSVVVAALIFGVSWNAYSERMPAAMVMLGGAFLGVALLDFGHVLAYAGMPDFVTPSGAEKAIYFWLAARYLATLALLALVLLHLHRPAATAFRYGVLALGLLFSALVFWTVLYHQDVLPRTFIPGEGLTTLKVWAEYLLVVLDLVAAVLLWRKMDMPQPYNVAALFGAVCSMAMSEFLFTLYADVTDSYNLLGHVYKIFSYAFLYRAVFITTVEYPFEHLQSVQSQQQATLEAMPDLMFDVGLDGRIYEFHSPHSELLAVPPEVFLGKRITEVLPPDVVEVLEAALREADMHGYSTGKQYRLGLPGGETWFELSISRKVQLQDEPVRFVALARDITERTSSEREILRLSRLYSALSHGNQAIVRCENEQALFEQICRDQVEHGGMVLAWISMADSVECQHLQLRAAYGAGTEALAGFACNATAAEGPCCGPACQALRTGEPYWIEDAGTALGSDRWRAMAAQYGWSAGAALPLHRAGKVVGVLTLYANEAFGRFDPADQALLREMATDIEFALRNYDREAERQQAVTSLAESSHLLRAIIDNAPMRIFWKDRDLRYLGCNPPFARDAGKAGPEDLVGRDDFQMVWRDQAEQYRADDFSVMRSGIPKLFYDEPQTTPEGNTIWLRTSKVPLFDAQQEVAGILGIYEDITQRKQIEGALMRSEANLKRAQSVAQVGSWFMNVITGKLEWSEEMCRIFGLGKRDAVNMDRFMSIVHPEDRDAVLDAWHQALEGEPYDIVHRIEIKGEVRWVHERAEIERDSRGRALFALGTGQDITARRQAEARIEYLARFDSLTALPNRTHLAELADFALGLARRNGSRLGLMFLDVDCFKTRIQF